MVSGMKYIRVLFEIILGFASICYFSHPRTPPKYHHLTSPPSRVLLDIVLAQNTRKLFFVGQRDTVSNLLGVHQRYNHLTVYIDLSNETKANANDFPHGSIPHRCAIILP